MYHEQKRRRGHKKHTIDAKKFGDSVTGDDLISTGYSLMVLTVRL